MFAKGSLFCISWTQICAISFCSFLTCSDQLESSWLLWWLRILCTLKIFFNHPRISKCIKYWKYLRVCLHVSWSHEHYYCLAQQRAQTGDFYITIIKHISPLDYKQFIKEYQNMLFITTVYIMTTKYFLKFTMQEVR